MANVPLDLKDEIAMRRFLSSLEGGNFIISGSTYINTSGWVADLPVLSLPVLSDYVKGRVAKFDELMQFTIDEVNYNVGILVDAVDTNIDILEATVNTSISTINTSINTVTTSLGTVNIRLDTVSSETGANTASISTLDQTYSTNLVVGALHSLTVTANGHVSGYTSIATGTNSVFNIYAEQFAVSSSSTEEGYSPFQIDTVGHKINMTSNVAIDGALVVAGTLSANRLQASTIWTDGSVQSSDFTTVGGAGFRLKANAAETYTDPTIYGAYIRGGTIYGTSIRADDITTGTLTADRILSGSLTVASISSFSQYIDDTYTPTAVVLNSYTYNNSLGVSTMVLINLNIVQTEGGTIGSNNTMKFELLQNSTIIYTGYTTIIGSSGVTNLLDITRIVAASNSTYTLQVYGGTSFGCTVSGVASYVSYKK